MPKKLLPREALRQRIELYLNGDEQHRIDAKASAAGLSRSAFLRKVALGQRVEAVPRLAGIERQTPRVTLWVRRTALARRPLGRVELKPLKGLAENQPGAELNFKLYRQATNKVVGLSDSEAAFLAEFF